MITTTLTRMSGKLIRNFGWWQFLVLAGACAWLTTPVDAQQAGYQSFNGGRGAGDTYQDDADDFPQSHISGPMFPRTRQWEDQWNGQDDRPARQLRQSAPWQDNSDVDERIDLRPGHDDGWSSGSRSNMSRRTSPNGDDSTFASPRHRRSNFRAPEFQDPDYSTPNFSTPNFQAPNRQGPAYQGQNLQGPAFQSPGMQLPGYLSGRNQTPNIPNMPGPMLPGQNSRQQFQAPGYPSPLPRLQSQTPVANPVQEAHTRITRRYQNQGFLSLLNLSPEQSIGLYSEVTQMIDSRHLEPSPVQARVQKGMTNLMYALDNPAFVQTNRLMLQPANVQAFRQALQQAMQSPVQSEQDALRLVSWTMQMSQQQIGLRPAATALEFVYGAVESLDKYSAFVPPERSPGASLQLESSLVGIGVQIEMRDQGAEVEKVISGSPAQSAGMQKGDIILAVSGQQLSGLDVDQTVSLISGPEGSQVVLGVQRNNQGPFTVTVTRKSIQLHSVNEIQMLNGSRVGYFKLDKFTATATEEVENALRQLHQQGMQSLIMDLRGNPGGLLTAAIQISDKFLPQGTIVATRGRTTADNTEERATKDHTWKIPLVVLVDHNSASASEIFAAAIQENQRGVVVGRTSYGKGTVQTQFPLQTAGCGLRITTAKFYSPTGRVMAGSGVTPDVPVAENSNGGNNAAYGVLDQDVQAALNVAQRGNLFQNPNLSGLPRLSQPRILQPFAQPQLGPALR